LHDGDLAGGTTKADETELYPKAGGLAKREKPRVVPWPCSFFLKIILKRRFVRFPL
jgi:hypothetical protein